MQNDDPPERRRERRGGGENRAAKALSADIMAFVMALFDDDSHDPNGDDPD